MQQLLIILKLIKKRVFWIVMLAVGILSTLIFYGRGRSDTFSQELQTRQTELNTLNQQIDRVGPDQTITFQLGEEVDLTKDTRRIPRISLSLAKAEWFTPATMQAIALYLEFDNQAVFTDLGNLKVWTQGTRTLSLETQQGRIEFSTNFNLQEQPTTSSIPAPDQANQTITDFFQQTQLPATYLDVENLQLTYVTLGANGTVEQLPAGQETGSLLRINLPHTVSGIPMILPVSNYIVIDGDGIRILNLLIPNIKQDSQQLIRLISWEKAQKQLQNGLGVVIELNEQNPGNSNLIVESGQVAYYLNQSTFYDLSRTRSLTPVYIFSGMNSKIAVLAEAN